MPGNADAVHLGVMSWELLLIFANKFSLLSKLFHIILNISLMVKVKAPWKVNKKNYAYQASLSIPFISYSMMCYPILPSFQGTQN